MEYLIIIDFDTTNVYSQQRLHRSVILRHMIHFCATGLLDLFDDCSQVSCTHRVYPKIRVQLGFLGAGFFFDGKNVIFSRDAWIMSLDVGFSSLSQGVV